MAATSRIATTAVGAATTIVLARLLGPTGWAAYAVAVSLLAILVATTTLGVEHGIAYFVSSGRWAARAAFDSALRVALVLGVVGAAAGLGVRLAVPSAFAGLSVWLTVVVVVGLPFALALFYTSYLALAVDRYEASMSMPAVQAILVLLLAVPAGAVYGIDGAVVAMTTAGVAVGLLAVVWGSRRLPRTGPQGSGKLRRAIAFGVKGYVANALQLVNYRLDLFILAAVASRAAVGNYALAVSVTTLLWLLPRALSDVLYPRVARLSGDGDEAAREMVETKSLRHASMIVGGGGILLAAVLELLLVPVFGEGFRPAVNLGLILLPGACAVGLSTVLAATVVGRGKPAYSLYTALVSTPVTLLLYAVLIPWLHADGAALASTLSYVTSFVMISLYYRRTTGRHVTPLLVPTRDELSDLKELSRMTRHWAAGRG